MKILCIGEALIDMICTDRGLPLHNGVNFLKKAGGAPANVAAAIAALGGKVQLAACVGADPFGQHLTEVMQDFGVDTQYIRKDPAHFTTLAFVSLMENGERDFFFNRGADAELSMYDLEGLQTADYSLLHFGSATAFLPGPLRHTYISLMQECRAQGTFFSFDPNYRELLFGDKQELFCEQCDPFIEHASFFKVSEEEAMLLAGEESPEAAAQKLMQKATGTFVITLGRKGAWLCRQDAIHHIPGVPVQAVDTTGAGDAFTGAMLYQLGLLLDAGEANPDLETWQSMIINANKAGAQTCLYMGAMEAYKHLNQSIFE